MPEGDSTWDWVHKFHQYDLPCQGNQGQIIIVVATGGLISCYQLWRNYKQYKKLKGDLRIKNGTSINVSVWEGFRKGSFHNAPSYFNSENL